MEREEITEEEDQDLYEHYKIVADKGQQLIRIDKFLVDRIPDTSRTRIQDAAKAGNIRVNEQPVKPNYKVKPGDVITIVLPYPQREIELIPENIPLDIVYEDRDLIVLHKAAGMVVHPGYGNYTGTLVNALIYHFENLPGQEKPEGRPGLVHRLDKNTSGLMVVAKTELAYAHLARQFFERTIERKYNALVWGDLPEDEGTITGNIGRSPRNRKVMTVLEDDDRGKHAVTHYNMIERFGYITWVECKLETGRTHQIRVHFKHIGHPLFNDAEYGGNRILKGTTFTKYKQFVDNCFKMLPRQALHAKSLGFTHPRTKKQLFFESELPEDMKTVIEKWRNYARYSKEEL